MPSLDIRFIKALSGYLDKISTIISHRAPPIKKDGLVNIIVTVLFLGGHACGDFVTSCSLETMQSCDHVPAEKRWNFAITYNKKNPTTTTTH